MTLDPRTARILVDTRPVRERDRPGGDPVLAASRPLLRSAAFAALALPLSATAHLAGGGAAPGATTVTAGLVFSFLLHHGVLARRERSWGSLFAGLSLAQVVVHTLLWLTEPSPAATATTTMATMHHGHAMPEATMAPAAPMPPGHAGHYGLGMLAWHACAAALLALLLRHGESLLWAAARRIGWVAVACRLRACRVAALPDQTRVGANLPAPHADRRPLRRRQLLWTAGQIRRGPPQVCRAG